MKFFCAHHDVAPRFDLLDRLGLGQKRKAQFFELSTGQQRRLALALAVAHEPDVLFLDEPTAGLDVASRTDLHNLMRERKAAGTTIILATHDMAEAEESVRSCGNSAHGPARDGGHAHGNHRRRRRADQGLSPHGRREPLDWRHATAGSEPDDEQG